jgi:hypothetical protein
MGSGSGSETEPEDLDLPELARGDGSDSEDEYQEQRRVAHLVDSQRFNRVVAGEPARDTRRASGTCGEKLATPPSQPQPPLPTRHDAGLTPRHLSPSSRKSGRMRKMSPPSQR